MNILIEIGHPAHVHFFSRAYSRLTQRGHRVIVVTRAKEMTNELLTRLGIPFLCLSEPSRGKFRMAIELLVRWAKIIRILIKEKADVAVSLCGISTSVPARLCGIRNIAFADTEDAELSNRIAFPFADKIFTPEFYLRDIGRKHVRYRGLHELSYLQHLDFEVAKKDRKDLGLPAAYSIVRTVGDEALHDSDIRGLTNQDLERLVAKLSRFGDVLISSPNPLPPSLEKNRMKIPVEKIHPVLAGALLFAGESPTMAVESSLLGVPAFLVSGRVDRLGNMVHLSRDYDLLRCHLDWGSLEAGLPGNLKEVADLQAQWRERARAFTLSCRDIDAMIISEILGEKA